MGRGAIVDISTPAIEALAAEGLDIDHNAVAGLYGGDGLAHLLYYAHHLVAHRDARDRSRHTAVLDVEVAGADAPEGHTHDGILRVDKRGLRFVDQRKLPFFDICICFHEV